MQTLTRSFRRVFSRVLAVTGLSLAAVAADASAAAAQPEKLFTDEVSNYRLTVSAMQKFVQATQNLDALEDTDVDLDGRFSDMDEDDLDLGRIASAFDSEPAIKTAINGAGLTSREYLTFLFAMIQTTITAAMLEIGGDNALAQMENSVLKQNVMFLREHKEEFEAMGEKLEAMGERHGDDGEDEDES
jgi:hypothetical protein